MDKTQQEQLSRGQIAIVKFIKAGETHYEFVAPAVAEKIAQRDASFVVLLNQAHKADTDKNKTEEDDWYAEYEIPDDLMW